MYDFMLEKFDYPSEHDIRKFVLSVQRKYNSRKTKRRRSRCKSWNR